MPIMERLARFAAVTGIIFAACLAASIVVSGNTPNSDATGAGVILFYKANKNSQNSSVFWSVLAVVFFVFFGAVLWNRLRRRLAESPLPAAGLVGVALIAVGGSIFSSLTFALSDIPDKIDPSTAQALNVLNNDLFFPFAIGVAVFLIANGLAIARGGVLPRWLGWIGIVIGLTAPTPLGIIGFFGSGAWVLVASVIMLIGDLRSTPGPAAAAAP
jgi:hypothetical protein